MAPSSKKTNKLLVVIVTSIESEIQPTKQSLALTLCVYVYTTIGGRERKVVDASKYSQFKHRRNNTLISRRKGILPTRVRITCNI